MDQFSNRVSNREFFVSSPRIGDTYFSGNSTTNLLSSPRLCSPSSSSGPQILKKQGSLISIISNQPGYPLQQMNSAAPISNQINSACCRINSPQNYYQPPTTNHSIENSIRAPLKNSIQFNFNKPQIANQNRFNPNNSPRNNYDNQPQNILIPSFEKPTNSIANRIVQQQSFIYDDLYQQIKIPVGHSPKSHNKIQSFLQDGSIQNSLNTRNRVDSLTKNQLYLLASNQAGNPNEQTNLNQINGKSYQKNFLLQNQKKINQKPIVNVPLIPTNRSQIDLIDNNNLNNQKSFKTQQSNPEIQQKAIIINRCETKPRYYYIGEKNDQGQKHGNGRLFNRQDMLLYSGEWANDWYHGIGVLMNQQPKKLTNYFDYRDFNKIQSYWEMFEGQFENGTMHGRGTLRLTNNEQFDGVYSEGMANGIGRFRNLNGQVVVGKWQNNQLVEVIH